jgi:hypothetical protein
MSSDNDLCELGGRLEDAGNELQRAAEVAIRLMGYDPAGGEPGWPEMADLVDRLEAMRDALAKLPGKGISEAIKQAEEHMDEMSDRADGLSY